MPRRLHTLKIVPFKNPGGSIAFRVTGRVLGEQVRKNFGSRSEAITFLDDQTRRIDDEHAIRFPVNTSLRESEIRDIEFAKLKLPPGAKIVEALDFYAQHFKAITPLKWVSAAARYYEHLKNERKTEEITAERREKEANNFGKHAISAGAISTDLVTKEVARAWIYDNKLDPRSQRDRYDRLNQFCAWLVAERAATFNPVEELVRPKVRVGAPVILTPTQIKALLDAAWLDSEGPAMLPHFAITCLSGVRPGECRRLKPEDVHLESKHPVIEINLAKGGRSRRIVEISPTLLPILQKCAELSLSPGYFSVRKFNRIRAAVGLYDIWTKDISRHSYASYRYEIDRDIDGLVKNMGNSAKVLFTNYVRAVTKEAAQAYDAIKINWRAARKTTLEGKRVDLWAKLPPETLSPVQAKAVSAYLKRRRLE